MAQRQVVEQTGDDWMERFAAPLLVVVSGLPGGGKTAIAEPLGARLGVPVFAKDWIEAPMLQSGWVSGEALGYVGYELLTTLAHRQLALGQSAIVDSVAGREAIRHRWRELAARHNARWTVIECVCSDETVHRERLSMRKRGIPGWPELTWDEVERVRGYFEPWSEVRLVLDACMPLDANIQRAIDFVLGVAMSRPSERSG